MRKYSLIFLFGVLLAACADEVKEKKVNTPMGVARIWLENYYYHNNYELAKLYSTEETAAMIDTIKTMIFPDQTSSQKLVFEVKNIQCKQERGQAKAECKCKYIEAGTPFTEVLHLLQKDGQWLVDAIEEDENLLEDEDIEKMTEDFGKALDRLLEQ